MEAQHPAKADSHVGIAGKVEIDVQGKGDGVHPGEYHGFLPGLPEQLCQKGEVVRQNHLFPQSHQKPADASHGIFPAVGSPFQLLCHIHIAHNGPGDELGKQRHIGAEADGVLLGRHRAPVHIDGVAQRLEGVEADTHRQCQMQQRQTQTGDGIDAGKEKVRILEKPQQPHTHHHGNQQPEFLPSPALRPSDGKAAEVEQGNGEHHQPQQPRLSPAVEKQAGKQQHGVFPPPGCQKINRHHRREKII